MKELELSVILECRGALAALDGYEKAVEKRTVYVPYRFKSDETRKKIIRALRILKPFTEEAEELRVAFVKELANPETPGFVDEMDGPKQTIFAMKWREAKKDKKKVVGLPHITVDELLNENSNPIPSTVLASLWPLTDEETAVEKATEVETD